MHHNPHQSGAQQRFEVNGIGTPWPVMTFLIVKTLPPSRCRTDNRLPAWR